MRGNKSKPEGPVDRRNKKKVAQARGRETFQEQFDTREASRDELMQRKTPLNTSTPETLDPQLMHMQSLHAPMLHCVIAITGIYW